MYFSCQIFSTLVIYRNVKILTVSTDAAPVTAMKKANANTVFIIACYLLVFLWRNETLFENELTFI